MRIINSMVLFYIHIFFIHSLHLYCILESLFIFFNENQVNPKSETDFLAAGLPEIN